MMPWQRQVADVAGEYDPGTGLPAYREVVVTVPRQSGKTTEQVVLQLDRALLWSPRPQRIAYTAQTGLDARKKIVNDVWPMLERSPFRAAVAKMLRGAAETAIEFRNGSRLEVFNSGEDAGHGQTLDQGFIDEAFADEDERREQAMLPAMTTRPDAQLFVYSTMGTGRSNYLNRKVAAGREAVAGGLTFGIAYFEWSAPDDADPDDPVTWWSCMPALGHTITEDSVRHARLTMTDGEFRRAYLNQQYVHEDRWLGSDEWEACRHPLGMQAPPDATPVVIGFDGSYNEDSTALVGCTLTGHVFVIGVWERPAAAGDDWNVPRDEVELAVTAAFRRWRVIRMMCDPYIWESRVEEWAERYGRRVVLRAQATRSRMIPACASFYGAVRQRQLTHDGSPDLARHLGNAIVKETVEGAYITKEDRHSSKKIDLAVAAVMAYAEAAKLGVKPSSYSDERPRAVFH